MGSVWMDDLRMPCFPPLWGQARTDVLIIGGGMTGPALRPYAAKRGGGLRRGGGGLHRRGHHEEHHR